MIRPILFALFFGITVAQAQESLRDPSVVTAKVTDLEDMPIEGAVAYQAWNESPRQNTEIAVSDSTGTFDFPIELSSPDKINCVVIHHQGFGFGSLRLDIMPARVRLRPARSIAVQVIDSNGQPINGARVTPGEVDFKYEFLHGMIPRALADKTAVVTKADGWTVLRNTDPSSLLTLVVEADGYGAQLFPCYFDDHSKYCRLQLGSTTLMDLQLLKDGEPAAGWSFIGKGSHLRPDRIDEILKDPKKPVLPCGILCSETTDAQGIVHLKHALAGREFGLFFVNKAIQRHGFVNIASKRDSGRPLIVQVPMTGNDIEGQEKVGRVVDDRSGQPVEGFRLSFTSIDWPNTKFEATSDQNGILNFKLLPGRWHANVIAAVEGYCDKLTSSFPIFVEDEEGERLADLTVTKAIQLKGAIQGIDLALHRARWIEVVWQGPGQNSGKMTGKVYPDATLEVSIPVDATAESFSIAPREDHDGRLQIQSLSPLILNGSHQSK